MKLKKINGSALGIYPEAPKIERVLQLSTITANRNLKTKGSEGMQKKRPLIILLIL